MPQPTKELLFTVGAAALANVSRQDGSTYACPTCTRLLTIEHVRTGDLTLEHVPPRAVGGKGIALTCRDCNSTAGHTVDAALHQRERFLDLGRAVAGRGGRFEGPVTLSINGVSTNAYFRIEGGRALLTVRETSNSPQGFRDQVDAVKVGTATNPGGGVVMNVDARLPLKFQRSLVGNLRSAFLAAFAQFGYRYAFHPRLSGVREQVIRPDEQTIEGAWWIADPQLSEDPMMMVQTAPFSAVLVRLGSALVVLPWVTGPDDVYAAARAHFAVKPAPATVDVLEWPQSLIMLLDTLAPAAS